MLPFKNPELNLIFSKLHTLGGDYAQIFLTNAAALGEGAAESEWEALLDRTMTTIRGQIEGVVEGSTHPGAQDAVEMMIGAVKGGFFNTLLARMRAEGNA